MSVLPAWLPVDVASGSTARPVVLRGTLRGHSRGDALTTILRVSAVTAWLGASLWLWRDPAWRPAIILVGALVGWSLDVVPDFVVALGLLVAWNLTGVGPTALSVSGFSSPAWLLMIGSLALGAGLTRSGLLERFALRLLLIFPATFRGQALGLTAGGLLMTPFLPMNVGRSAMSSSPRTPRSSAPRRGGSSRTRRCEGSASRTPR